MSSLDNNAYDDDLDDLDDLEDCWNLSINYFINHVATSREGVVNASLKGGDSDYIHRKMVKIMRSMRDPTYDQLDNF
ncbi:orphan [Acanthamoeba polyphaga mimivirus]|nr:orphan [Mimivirus reunion]WMV62272.1 orphan [Mimivirus sp.]WMV63249.1 orphan [Acanthamoeba polyphaga mimivirus]WMV64226.1 orphan [Mimivirus sp.]